VRVTHIKKQDSSSKSHSGAVAFNINLWRFEMKKISKLITVILFLILTFFIDTTTILGFLNKSMKNHADGAKYSSNNNRKVFFLIEYPVGALILNKSF